MFCCLFHKHEKLYVVDWGRLCCYILGRCVSFLEKHCMEMVRSPSPGDWPQLPARLWFGLNLHTL